MFGYVTANGAELTEEEKHRYGAVYCGICRAMRIRSSNLTRLTLSYDMAFLALLLMSLYEPEEESGSRACMLHPFRPHPWVDNEYIQYAADMNVALAYYNCLDDWEDDKKLAAKGMAAVLNPHIARIRAVYGRQLDAVEQCIARLRTLEKEGCDNPDTPANCFGELMGELLVYREDLWAVDLRQTGFSLGRFIYLTDAAVDYRRDVRKKQYNPFLAMGTGEDYERWEQYLILAMARCTEGYERLPLVQDKKLLDNILYGGVWRGFREAQRKAAGGRK